MSENGVTLDPNKLFVSRPSSSQTSPPRSARSNISGFHPERMQFGLAWINLTYSPKSFISNETKTILRNVSGHIKFGEIMGVMGPSGCGKSTLLRCINGRIASGLSADTKIYVSNSRSIHSCFIVQDQKEHLLMNLTTNEILLYASKIKNNTNNENTSSDFSDEESNKVTIDQSISSNWSLNRIKRINNFDHNSNIRKLLNDLTLNDCGDTMVSNCSGGQQKRIVIALELVAQNKPNIMCIDEPTSGLDSNAAEQVIDCLRDICRKHSIGILTTIHQPNSDILYMFDTLYVLSKGGYCVFNDRPTNLRAFLLKADIALKDIQVPIEVLMKLASKTTFADIDSEEFIVDEDIKLLAENTKKNDRDLRQKCYTFGKLSEPKNITIRSVDFSILDFWVLIQRSFKCSIIRGWKTIVFITFYELGAALFIAYLFGRPGLDDGCLSFDPSQPINATCLPVESINLSKEEPNIVKNFKLMFFLILNHSFLQLCFTILTFPIEVKLFFNEQQNRWYSSGAYFWAKNLIDSFIGIIITFVLYSPIYLATGQRGTLFEKYFYWYLLSNLLVILCIQGMANTFSIIAVKNFRMCLILGIGGLLGNTMLSGFLIPVNSMDPIIKSISYISFVRMGFETQVFTLYGFNRCDPQENRWSLVLYQFGFEEDHFYLKLYLLVFLTVFWRLLALVCLIIKTNEWHIIPTKKNYQKNSRDVVFIRDGSDVV